MKNVLIVNHSIEKCGVYQYGKRVSNICKKSKKINFFYIEVNSSEELLSFIHKHNFSAILYNYVSCTMPWMNNDIFGKIKRLSIKQGTIIHNQEYSGFDFYLHQNPYYVNNENNFFIHRPLFEYTFPEKIKKNDILQIGTFGFGGKYKFIDQICRAINEEFVTQKVELNLLVTTGFYTSDIFNEIKSECIKNITRENITINMSNNFLSDQELLEFLFNNDLNIFFYEDYSYYNGISSSIDYALSVKKPIAICKSSMFSHVLDVRPSICVEDTNLIDIINNGFYPLEEKYNSWSHKNFIDNIEFIFEKIWE